MIKIMKKKILVYLMFIFLIETALAIPSIPHAFYGSVKDVDGNSISDDYLITARIDNQPVYTSSVVKNGEYGYEDSLLVSDLIGGGDKVYFYVNGKLVENEPADFIVGGITNIDLIVDSPPEMIDCGNDICNIETECSFCAIDCSILECNNNQRCDAEIGENCLNSPEDCGVCEYCGDSICNNGETCSSCSGDCGACNPGGGSSSGGGSSVTPVLNNLNETNSNIEFLGIEELNEGEEKEEEFKKNPGITGGVIGVLSGGTGIGLIVVLLFLLVALYVIFSKKKLKRKSKLR